MYSHSLPLHTFARFVLIEFYMKEDWGSEKLINTKLVSGRGFSVGLVIKNPPVMQEMQVQSLSWEDPLEKEMATHASIPAWDIPWTEEPGRLQCMGLQKRWARLSD